MAAVATVSVAAIAGCGSSTTYEGEYKYANAWVENSYYGVKVSVTLDSDDVIESVSIVESDYVTVTDSWENKSTWENGVDSLLAAYSGKSAAEVMAQYVACETDGTPTIQSGDGFNAYDSTYLITGATQGSGRLLLAVQNALENAGYKSYVGEYKYENTYAAGSYYGIKVNVVVKDSTIQKVTVIDTDYIEVSSANPDYGWTSDSVANWNNNLDSLLAKYEGKTVSAIKALTVACASSGEPYASSFDEFVSYDSDLLLTGATQGSGRLLLAVQNAIASL